MHGRKLITTGTIAALAILAVVGGCREATTGPTSVKPQDFASSVKLLSGNLQSGTVGVSLPEVLSVKVVDAGGLPVAGATVLWQVRDGGGTVSPPASTTSSAGLATVSWTLGTTLGANKAVALLQGNYVLDSVVFTATAKTGPAQQFARVSGNLQTSLVASRLPQALVVNVKDQYGYPVAGARVTWTAALFSGTVTPLADSTDATGNVSATWTLGTAAIGQSVTASVTGLTSIVFNATATTDTTRVFTATAGTGQTAAAGSALPTQLSVLVKDAYGNLVVGDTVFWNDSIGAGGSVSPLLSVTNALGVATSTWTIGGTPGIQTVRARLRPTKKLSFTATGTLAYAQVFAGNYQTCAIATNDRAYCWGYGEDGQLGKGNAKTIAAPSTPVTSGDSLAGPFLSWRQIGAGSSYTCGISIARQLYCWGRLASAVQTNSPLLKSFTTVLSFQNVTTAETHSCALSIDGILGCTGSNSQGQLGDGTQVDQLAGYAVVAAGLPLTAVALGQSHTCAMPHFNPADSINTSKPRCWGSNTSGQLGQSSISANVFLPTAITMPLLTAFDSTSLVAGAAHTCALTRAGAAFCWGSNGSGQLGTGLLNPRDSVPQAVTGGLVFSKLYAGEYHTCGVTTTGQAYCWGRNNSAQLGDGTRTNQTAPVLVAGGLSWRSLALGELHSCGVASPTGTASGTQTGAGVIYCWGDNEYGQAGTGTASANNTPIYTPLRVGYQP
ncbi:MAG: hypothetical protein NTW72_04480 [Gemmatimonadetes bacterium]|nr:hypothetical protein [Gemmatimonadota bacterium]